MKLRLTIIILMVYTGLNQNIFCQSLTDIKIIRDTAFKFGADRPYTGEFNDYYPGNLKTTGIYLNGLKNGEFIYYANDYHVDSIINYQLGKKNGLKKAYDVLGYLDYIESYLNDTLDGDCYYWAPTSELETIKSYSKGKLLKERNFTIDRTIDHIEIYISGEEDKTSIKTLYKDEICKKDSIKLQVAKVVSTYIPIDSLENRKEDTIIVLKNYRVISCTWACSLYTNSDRDDNSHSDIAGKCKSNISQELIKEMCENYPREFYLEDIIIINPDGYIYSIPSIQYKIKEKNNNTKHN